MSGALAQGTVQPVAWLLEQVRIGEARGREDPSATASIPSLVEPDHLELLAAQARQALRQGKVKEAGALLARLGKQDPDSALYRQGMANLALNEPARRQQLQQARLLTSAGRLEEAERLYRSLFSGDLPQSRRGGGLCPVADTDPGHESEGAGGPGALNRQYPGEPRVQGGLARLYLAEGRRQGRRTCCARWRETPISGTRPPRSGSRTSNPCPSVPGASLPCRSTWCSLAKGIPPRRNSCSLPRRRSGPRLPIVHASRRSQARREVVPPSPACSVPWLPTRGSRTHGALGQAYSRNDQRAQAIAQFERVLAHPEVTDKDKWRSLLATNRYWLLVSQGRSALEQEQWDEAATLYRRAIAQDGREPEAWLGLGDSERGRHRDADAGVRLPQALAMGSARERALARLFDLYKEQDPARALAPAGAAGHPGMQAEGRRLKAGLLQEEADQPIGPARWRRRCAFASRHSR